MNELERLGDEPVSYRRPANAEQPNAVGQFLLTAGAVWVGAMLAGICLFFLGRSWLAMEMREAAAESKARVEEAIRKMNERKP